MKVHLKFDWQMLYCMEGVKGVMDITWFVYGCCVIPIAGILWAVIMLIWVIWEYGHLVLKLFLTTVLVTLVLLGISLIPSQSESYVGLYLVGLPLTILGPAGGFGLDWWILTTFIVWLNCFGVCSFFLFCREMYLKKIEGDFDDF